MDNLSNEELEKSFGLKMKHIPKLKKLKQRLKFNIDISKTHIHKLGKNRRRVLTPSKNARDSNDALCNNASDSDDTDPLLYYNSSDSNNNDIEPNTSENFGEDMYTNDDGIAEEFNGYGCEHSDRMRDSLRDTFRLNELRPYQLQTINATMKECDCMVLQPTSAGKSLCYQLPATLTKTLTIVVSPLKSLIIDQMSKVKALGMVTCSSSGDQIAEEVKDIYRQLETSPPSIRVLFVTPDKISASQSLKNTMMKLYENHHIARFVIDEAHCIR